AGADADTARAARDVGQCHRGRRARDARQIVVFGHPEAPVTQRLYVPREVERIAQRLPGIAAFGNWREVENGEWDHRIRVVYRGSGQRVSRARYSADRIAVASSAGLAIGGFTPPFSPPRAARTACTVAARISCG